MTPVWLMPYLKHFFFSFESSGCLKQFRGHSGAITTMATDRLKNVGIFQRFQNVHSSLCKRYLKKV